ncbi:hypothetical protein Vretifemale_1011 [Volvox reticuliferus]|uniref:Uncharacterized protein n=1 Tax=Volvox reticuliferus TaxID=1737510 RepID=A0A8J4C2J6_9CHLO|nr:hypothetical protein Vretifemale_1011 [Volvox reticuliferus]
MSVLNNRSSNSCKRYIAGCSAQRAVGKLIHVRLVCVPPPSGSTVQLNPLPFRCSYRRNAPLSASLANAVPVISSEGGSVGSILMVCTGKTHNGKTHKGAISRRKVFVEDSFGPPRRTLSPLGAAPMPTCTVGASTIATRAPILATPGLLGMPGWHHPTDLDPWVDSILCRASQLQRDLSTCGPGLRLLALLHDHELLLRNSHRPVRYCVDFHPDRAWSAAATAALTRLDAAYDALYGDAGLYEKLTATQTAVEVAMVTQDCHRNLGSGHPAGRDLARGGAHVDPGDNDPLVGLILYELGQHRGLEAAGLMQWLQFCRALRPLFRRNRQEQRTTAVVAAVEAAPAVVAPNDNENCSHNCNDIRTCGDEPRDDLAARHSVAGNVAGGVAGGGSGDDSCISSGDGEGVRSARLQQLQLAISQCSETLRRLAAGRPPWAPRLALHPAQLELLQPWLTSGDEAAADGGANGGTGSGGMIEWVTDVELLDLWATRHETLHTFSGGTGEKGASVAAAVADVTAAAPEGGCCGGGAGSSGGARAAATLHGGRGGHLKLSLYDVAPSLDLDELLFDATDEALEFAAATADREECNSGGAGGGGSESNSGVCSTRNSSSSSSSSIGGQRLLPVVLLSPELAWRLLQLHPNEGLRWQVYHSGPLRQVRAMMAVMEPLTTLRRQMAEAVGYSCWTDLVIQGGGAARAGGEGGGGVAGVGSALGGRAAIVRMLRELGEGLMSYGDR